MKLEKSEEFYKKSSLIPIADDNLLRRMIWQQRVSNRLDKYYVIHKDPLYATTEIANSNVIWWLWYQGSENAPDIVKICLESVKYYAKRMQYRVIELNTGNLFDYINLPNTIIDKWKAGNIGAANFSDLVRADLLANRGGYGLTRLCICQGILKQNFSNRSCFSIKHHSTMLPLQKSAVGL